MTKRLTTILMIFLFLCTAVAAGAAPVVTAETPEANPRLSASMLAAYGWLSAQQDSAVLDGSDEISGLVDSFEDYSGPDQPITEAFTYDQAVAAIAFLVAGDVERATTVLTTLQNLQAEDGSWCNSYWYGGYWGAELRKHVGPAVWVSLAVMNYERITGDAETFHAMAVAALDWALGYQRPNGGIAGGETTWDVPGVWTEEVWTGTEHNIDAYPALLYFADTTPARRDEYNAAVADVLAFLTDVVWDDAEGRFFGGFKNDTQLVDPWVPLDVNPWAVLALGTDYAEVLDYVEDAVGDPVTGVGTLAHPKYVQTLTYDDEGSLMTGYDFDWQDDGAAADPAKGGGTYAADIWIEGTVFMACAYYAVGDEAKGDAILSEVEKKMGAGGSMAGGLPYSLKASNNHYWRMLQQNCVSSTGWFVIAAAGWNPFQGEELDPLERVQAPTVDVPAGQYADAVTVALASATPGATIRFTLDGSVPDETSPSYADPIRIDSSTVLTVRAFAEGLRPSETAVFDYVVDDRAQMPVFSLDSGTYAGPQTVSIATATDGGEIRYTLDGTVPTADSPLYGGPLEINSDAVVTAVVFRSGLEPSPVIRVRYVILAVTASPTLSVPSGTYDEPVEVSITHPDADAVIRYTLDGSAPTAHSPAYDGPITIVADVTVRAVAIVAGGAPSAVVEATYEVAFSETPYSLTEGSSSATITWLTDCVYVDIHYVKNGGGQQNVRMVENGATGHPEITINGLAADDELVFWFTVMVAVQNDTEHFTHVFGTSEPEIGTVSTPTAEVAGGDVGPRTVTLSCVTAGAEIRYALGVGADVAFVVYQGPITIEEDAVLSFYAVKDGMADSAAVTETVEVDLADEPGPDPFEVIEPEPTASGLSTLATILIATGGTIAAGGTVVLILLIRRRRILG
ncbi:MAG: chitobiase/beta-hexosaminidase C-terminal domain-containing protein [Candidatus Izemoplasmatales bacterium]